MTYCENCGKNNLIKEITLRDGTIVCSEKCKEELLLTNRKELDND